MVLKGGGIFVTGNDADLRLAGSDFSNNMARQVRSRTTICWLWLVAQHAAAWLHRSSPDTHRINFASRMQGCALA